MSVRLAIIGAGVMGADHARIVAESVPGATLSVVCDQDAATARRVADACGAADAVTDGLAAVRRGDVDAVIIASPDPTHVPLSKLCIQLGKPALCEKPLSQSSAECIDVMQAEMAAGSKLVQVGFMRRYDRPYQDMRTAIGAAALGRILMMHNFHRNVATPYAAFTGAMAITNSAPHEFDIVRHVMGTEFTRISAWQPKRTDDVVAPVVMVLETADDQLVTVEVNNNAAYGYDVRAELIGEAGSMSMSPPAPTRTDRDFASASSYHPDWRAPYEDAYRRQNTAFVRFAAGGAFPETAATCWDGYCAARIAEAGVEALAAGGAVAIDMIDRPDFYR
ncbi:MAG: Gfo/Idh/MocA family protein [Candidatus Puniceispirillaceae bacterium]